MGQRKERIGKLVLIETSGKRSRKVDTERYDSIIKGQTT